MGADPDLRPRVSPDVAAWRMKVLRDAGFEATLARRLAGDGQTDLHDLLRLVDQGCPPQTAARILAPL